LAGCGHTIDQRFTEAKQGGDLVDIHGGFAFLQGFQNHGEDSSVDGDI
jgi:hypothetical protein